MYLVAKRLNIADKIIVLNKDGRIIKQGPTEQLSDVEHDVDTDPGLAQHPPAELASDYVSNAARRAEEAMQADRQIGDLEVYKYYFASLGWVGFSIFALCVASDGAFTSMQSKYPFPFHCCHLYLEHHLILENNRCLVEIVGGK